MTGSALVIGGGPAGCEVASRIARTGREVVLLERERHAVDKVCGEFLSREAVLYLEASGVDLRSLGAVPIDAVRLVEGETVAEVALPFQASSLSRRVLDEALIARAARDGVRVQRGCLVQSLSRPLHRFNARLADGRVFESESVLLATGKHDVRGHKRTTGLQNDLVAFKMHYLLTKANAQAIDRTVELILFRGGYAGLQPIEDGFANLCLLVSRSELARHDHRFDSLVGAIATGSRHFARRLAGSVPRWSKPLALSAIPYGYIREHTDGPYWLGDQAAVIPSFSGDGISIALHSARLAADTYIAGGAAHVYQRALSRDITSQVLLATAVSHGLVHTRLQRVLARLAHRFPGLVESTAFRTRVADAALQRSGLLDANAQ